MRLQFHRVQTRVRKYDRAERIYQDVQALYEKLWEVRSSEEEHSRMWAAYDRLKAWADSQVVWL